MDLPPGTPSTRLPDLRFVILLPLVIVGPLRAQQWNPPEALALVNRAVTLRRAGQTDSALTRYRSRADGVVLFLVQPGEPAAPLLARADQLAVEVYWQAPDRSKQRITAWRERRWLPTGIQYHRDHLGIVTDDFGDSIRIGEGDEVRDVPHPLSPGGPSHYDYALAGTVTIQGPGGDLVVREVQVRPKRNTEPLVAGSLYLEAGTAALLRFRFSFTGAAYLQAELEDISVVLENALHEGRWWLPYRQEIAIRRRSPWLDIPFRTLIHGRWEITGYDFAPSLGPEAIPGGAYGGLLVPGPEDSTWSEPLEDVAQRAVERQLRTDIEGVRREVAALIGRAAVARPPARPALGSVSDLVRVNRVQGVALGLGLNLSLGQVGLELSPRLGYGLSDHRLTGGSILQLRRDDWDVAFRFTTGVEDIGDRPIISPLLNSVLSMASGQDHGDWVRVERAVVEARWHPGPAISFRVRAGRERGVSLETRGAPLSGVYRPNPPLGTGGGAVGGLGLEVGDPPGGPGARLRAVVEAGSGGGGYVRGSAAWRGEAPVHGAPLVLQLEAGAGTARTPPWRTFVLGGRGTLPGEPFRAYGGRWSVLGRLEWRLAVETVPGGLVLAPFLTAGWAGDPAPGLPWTGTEGLRPAVGVASELLFQLLRIEAGWAVRSRRLGVTLDATPAWWPIL